MIELRKEEEEACHLILNCVPHNRRFGIRLVHDEDQSQSANFRTLKKSASLLFNVGNFTHINLFDAKFSISH